MSWSGYGPSLLEKTWLEMDRVTEQILDADEPEPNTPEHAALAALKGRARGIAYTLSLFMVPHFDTENAIVREAVKRIQMKRAGEIYETAGLFERRYEAPPSNGKISTVKITLAKDAQKAICESPIDSVMLAKIYKVSVQQIEAIRAQSR